MPIAQIIIQQNDTNTAPGSRDGLALNSPITLTNQDNTGVKSWLWTLTDKPANSSASITNHNGSVASFTPDVVGTYLISLSVNSGASTNEVGAAVNTKHLNYRIPALKESDQFGRQAWAIAINKALERIDEGHGENGDWDIQKVMGHSESASFILRNDAGGFYIHDARKAVDGNIFEVDDTSGASKYFQVSSKAAAFGVPVNMTSNGISGVSDPKLPNDAATKGYVDRSKANFSSNFDTSGVSNTSVDLTKTGVVPGLYHKASIAVDSFGRIISAANGDNAGGGTITEIDTAPRLTGGPITSTGTIDLATTGITAGTYNNITFDVWGRATSGTTVGYITSVNDIGAGQITNDKLASNSINFVSGDGSITLNGAGVLGGTEQIALNTANSNTWTATQTFNSHIVIDGKTIDLMGEAVVNQVLQFNGTVFTTATLTLPGIYADGPGTIITGQDKPIVFQARSGEKEHTVFACNDADGNAVISVNTSQVETAALMPIEDGVSDLGAEDASWADLYVHRVFNMSATQPLELIGQCDYAGVVINNLSAGKILSAQIRGEEKLFIDDRGFIGFHGAPPDLPPPLTWNRVSFLNQWDNTGNGFYDVGYYKDALGWVHLRGNANNGGSPTDTICQLPPGFRPNAKQHFSAPGVEHYLEIDSAGNITPDSATAVSLDGISFYPEA